MRNLLSAIAILLVGCGLSYLAATSKPGLQSSNDNQASAPVVDIEQAQRSSKPMFIESQGLVAAAQKIQLTSEVSGKVTYVSKQFYNGASISANKTLLRINPTAYEANLAQAKAQLTQTQERYTQEKARARQAKKEWRDLGSDEANDLFLRKPQLATLEAQLQANKAAIKAAEKALANTNIKLDFVARITKIHVNKGQFVSTGTALATIYANDKLQVILPISQQQLSRLGLQWPIKADDFPSIELNAALGNTSQQWQAKVVQIGADINPQTQQLSLIAKLSAQSPLLPGQFVQAKIFGKQQSNVYRVPLSAFHDKQYLLLLADQHIQFIKANYLANDGDHVLLQATLPDNANIVTSSLPLAFDGMTITPQQSTN